MGDADAKVNVQRDGVSKKRKKLNKGLSAKPNKKKKALLKKRDSKDVFNDDSTSVPNEDQILDSTKAQSEQQNGTSSPPTGEEKPKRNKKSEMFKQKKSAKQREYMLKRERFDKRLRTEPHAALWEEYVAWAGERLTNVERKQEQWTSEQVMCLEDDNPGGGNMMDKVKDLIGSDYKTRSGYDEKKSDDRQPCVACLAVALSTETVLSFAKRLYDGKPVGKFFSKHMKSKHQAAFLKNVCKSSILPTAAGNVSRLDRLISDGSLSLEHTQALLLDFGRDSKLFNLVEHNYRDAFFDLIHKYVRAPLASGLKMVVVIPTEEKMPKDRTWGAGSESGKDINAKGSE